MEIQARDVGYFEMSDPTSHHVTIPIVAGMVMPIGPVPKGQSILYKRMKHEEARELKS